jgi:predicted nucleotidyltransferase
VRRDEVLRILRDHREEFRAYGVKHLVLFGSVARDEAGPDSDVDILVEFDEPVGLFRLLDLKDHLERLLGARVDLGTEDGLQPRTRARVLKEVVSAV